MKTKLLLIMICILPSKLMAYTRADIKPVLIYDEDYAKTHHLELKMNQYLNVVIEDTKFPEHPQEERFHRALNLLEEVLNSAEFKQKVITYIRSSNGKREYQKNYIWNNEDERLSNEEIYNLIMNAEEYMIPNSPEEMNVFAFVKKCRWYESWRTWCRKVIGSTNPSKSQWMKLNWKFYRDFKTSNMVSNLVHEWLHLLGFLHGREHMREEVPYVVGSIAGEVAQNLLEKRGEEN